MLVLAAGTSNTARRFAGAVLARVTNIPIRGRACLSRQIHDHEP